MEGRQSDTFSGCFPAYRYDISVHDGPINNSFSHFLRLSFLTLYQKANFTLVKIQHINFADIYYNLHQTILTFNDLNYFPRDKFLDSSKMKEFADDNFKFDVNRRKLSKRVENTVGRGEIARYEQFLLFPQCFQKTCTTDT